MSLKKCPICEAMFSGGAYSPFCSKRCADLDLGRWLKGSYVIPGPSADAAEEAPGRREPGADAE